MAERARTHDSRTDYAITIHVHDVGPPAQQHPVDFQLGPNCRIRCHFVGFDIGSRRSQLIAEPLAVWMDINAVGHPKAIAEKRSHQFADVLARSAKVVLG
jgi:hypothetical protein